MCVVGFFAFLFVSVIYLFKFGFSGYHEKLILPAAFLTAYFILNKGVKYFVEKNIHLFTKEDSGFYRRTGMVRVWLKGELFEAPFSEFDAWWDIVHIGNGGTYPMLKLVHRYKEVAFELYFGFLGSANKNELYSVWLILQRYMDVSQPLPDLPAFEIFRELDPVTAEFDRQSGRDPRRWRNSTYEQWQETEEKAMQQRLWDLNYNIPDLMESYVMDCGPRSPRSQPDPATLAVRIF
jgi:hypothetical protein